MRDIIAKKTWNTRKSIGVFVMKSILYESKLNSLLNGTKYNLIVMMGGELNLAKKKKSNFHKCRTA